MQRGGEAGMKKHPFWTSFGKLFINDAKKLKRA
jgi:hypothetical protein